MDKLFIELIEKILKEEDDKSLVRVEQTPKTSSGRVLYALEAYLPDKIHVDDNFVVFEKDLYINLKTYAPSEYARRSIRNIARPLYNFFEEVASSHGLNEKERMTYFSYLRLFGANMSMPPFLYSSGLFFPEEKIEEYKDYGIIIEFTKSSILYFEGYTGDIGNVFSKKVYTKTIFDKFLKVINSQLTIDESPNKVMKFEMSKSENKISLADFVAILSKWLILNPSKAEKFENLPEPSFLKVLQTVIKQNPYFDQNSVIKFDTSSGIDPNYFYKPVSLVGYRSLKAGHRTIMAKVI